MPIRFSDDHISTPVDNVISIQDGYGDEIIHQNSHVITGKKIRLTFNWKRVVGGKFRIYIWEPGKNSENVWKLWKAFDSIGQAEAEYERLKMVL